MTDQTTTTENSKLVSVKMHANWETLIFDARCLIDLVGVTFLPIAAGDGHLTEAEAHGAYLVCNEIKAKLEKAIGMAVD